MAEQNTEAQQQAPEQQQPQEQVVQPKPQARLPEGQQYIWGTGRRKKSIARVRIRPGSGQIRINDRESTGYFTQEKQQKAVQAPLAALDMQNAWDVWVNVQGGGYAGQAGAVSLGLARALARAVPEGEHSLRDRGLLTRDARMKERKKYGRRGARRSFQFSKR